MKTKIILLVCILSISACRKNGNPIDPCDCDKKDTLSIPTNGLIAYYPFDGNANDKSGNEFHGISYGAEPAFDRFGKPAKSFTFDGVDDQVKVEYSPSSKLELKNSITISCFVKGRSTFGAEESSRIIRTTGDFLDGYELNWNHRYNGQISAVLIYNTSGTYTPGDKIFFPNNGLVGEWHHIAMSYSKQTKKLLLYVDGSLIASKDQCGYTFSSSRNLLSIGGSGGAIGSDRHLYHESFPGSIDDVRIYDRVLSDSEINALYHEGGYKK